MPFLNDFSLWTTDMASPYSHEEEEKANWTLEQIVTEHFVTPMQRELRHSSRRPTIQIGLSRV